MPPRSRNFDGCWTCRLRKIKCDRGRPRCERCARAGVECKGYGVVLSWGNVLTVNLRGEMVAEQAQLKGAEKLRENCFSRRKLDLVRYPPSHLYELFSVLGRAIGRFDDVLLRLVNGRYFYGPFGAFKLGNLSPRELPKHIEASTELSASSLRLFETPDLAASIAALGKPSSGPKLVKNESVDVRSPSLLQKHPSNSNSRTSIHETSVFSKTDNAYVHYKLLDSAKLTVLAIKGLKYRFTEQGMHHILYPKFFVNVESDEWSPSIENLSEYVHLQAGGSVTFHQSIAKSIDAVRAKNLPFIRVVHSNNCWDELVVSKIKTLMFEVIFEEYPQTGSWGAFQFNRQAELVLPDLMMRNIKFCIVCMVFSIGKYLDSLSHPPVKNPVDSYLVNNDLKASIELRKVAINYINFHLDEYDSGNPSYPQRQYENYFLLALILQIHIDNLFGVFENYDLIYAVGERLACLDQATPEDTTSNTHLAVSPYERYLQQVFEFFHLFYASAHSVNSFNYSIPEQEVHQKYRDLEGDYDLTKAQVSDDESDDEEKPQPEGVYQISSGSNATNEPLSFTVHFNKGMHLATMSSEQLNAFAKLEKLKPKKLRKTYTLTANLAAGVITPNFNLPNAYVSLGLPKSLVQLLKEVVKLTNEKRIFKLRGVTPRNYPHICAEIKDKILNWNVESYWKLYDNEYDPITNQSSKKYLSIYHEGLNYNIECFYQALHVYYYRLIPETSILQYQEHVEACFEAMNKLSRIRTLCEKNNSEVQFSLSFWPLLVCGSDIDLRTNIQLRAQCELLWKEPSFLKYNFWRSKQILFEIWKRQEEDNEYNGFMDMVREWDIVLNL